MIRRTVSAALLLRDSFTGRPVLPAAGILCHLDGKPVRQVQKPEGYLILTDLEPGGHILSLRCKGYREEEIPLTVPERGVTERELDLTPGAGYPFPAETARLRLTVPGAGGETLWAAMAGHSRLKLAQEKSREEKTAVRLFCSGDPARLPVPGTFLAIDEEGPELIRLRALRGDTGEFFAPMLKAHPRNTELRPARSYRADGEGKAELLFPRGGEVFLLCRDRWTRTEVSPGDQDLLWPAFESVSC